MKRIISPGRLRRLLACIGVLISISVASVASASETPAAAAPQSASAQAIELFDDARQRRIPVLLYGASSEPKPLAVISHGYGGRNSGYSFIAKALVERGFVVASIQHQLPDDPPLPTEGNPAVVRRPSWQMGVENMLFVIRTLQERGVAKARSKAVLIGHSHGGDASMLFATQHPNLVETVFSLDNRRMALPRSSQPRVCSIRSSDLPADPGVLPTEAEQREYRMLITTIPGLIHNNMWDGKATEVEKSAMLGHLFSCLGL